MKFHNDINDFILSLNNAGVKYVVIGGVAVSIHGFSRATEDIDFFFESTTENAAKIVNAIQSFGFGSLGITVDDLLEPDTFFQLGRAPNRIDITNKIEGVEFDDVWRDKILTRAGGLTFAVISKQHLILNKIATRRPKDLIDADELKHLPDTPL